MKTHNTIEKAPISYLSHVGNLDRDRSRRHRIVRDPPVTFSVSACETSDLPHLQILSRKIT